MITGAIRGTGSYIPEKAWDNLDLTKFIDTSDEWIQKRTGVKRRHIVSEETTAFMAAEAAKRAIENAKIEAAEIDLILVSTVSSDVQMPCTACRVQEMIGAVNAFGFDINAACTGFVYAYQSAMGFLSTGMCKNILIIGSETLSNIVNWEDRNTCILFGDGAGAVVLSACEGRGYKAISRADGSLGSALTFTANYTKHLKNVDSEDGYVHMDGQSVFTFAIKKIPEVIEEVLSVNQLKKADIDFFVLHQANRRIIESIARKIGVGIEQFPMNLQEYGNTSSASIPILLDELNKSGRLKVGQRLVLAGFGGGLAWGAVVLEWMI